MTFFTLRVEVATGPSVKGAGTAQHWFRGGQLWKPLAVGRERVPADRHRQSGGRPGSCANQRSPPSLANPTRTQRKGPGRSRSSSGMWRAGGPSPFPQLAHTSVVLWRKGHRRCPEGTCDKLMEGNGSKTLLLGRRSITRPVNSCGGVSESTHREERCTLIQEGQSRPTGGRASKSTAVLGRQQISRSLRRRASEAQNRVQGQRGHCVSDGERVARAMSCLERSATEVSHSSDEPRTKRNS